MSDTSKGYIYVRFHESYDLYNACKLGKTNNIPERDNQYSTGEIKRGMFKFVYEVASCLLDEIEKYLQHCFKS